MKYVPPKKIHSANIQAEFYSRCRKLGIPCVLEYRYGKLRFDAIIHNGKDILAIVEVKNHKYPNDTRHSTTRQIAKYSDFGAPVILLNHYTRIEKAIDTVISIISEAA